MSFGKVAKVNPAESLDYVNNWTPRGVQQSLGPLGGIDSQYNYKTKTTKTTADINPFLSQGFNQFAQRGLGFDQQAQNRAQQAIEGIYQPTRYAVQGQIQNFLGGMGPAGRRNSQGLNLLAQFGGDMARNEAGQYYNVANQARQNVLQENSNLFNQYSQPVQNFGNMAAGIGQNLQGITANRAQTGANMLQQAATLNAQMANQERQSNMVGIGQLAGGLTSFGLNRFFPVGGP